MTKRAGAAFMRLQTPADFERTPRMKAPTYLLAAVMLLVLVVLIRFPALSIGIPKETEDLEKRVAQTPESVAKLVKEGFSVKVEKGAGVGADFSDAAYTAAGATIVDRETAFGASLVRVLPVHRDRTSALAPKSTDEAGAQGGASRCGPTPVRTPAAARPRPA